MAYGGFKDLTRTTSDKRLRDKAFNIAENPKYVGYQRRLLSIIYKYFYKKSTLLAWSEMLATWYKPASGSSIINENILNKELAQELHKPIIRKSKKRKIHSPFTDNICGADLADI